MLALGKSVESSSMKTKGKYMRWVKVLEGLGLVSEDFSFPTDLPLENEGVVEGVLMETWRGQL